MSKENAQLDQGFLDAITQTDFPDIRKRAEGDVKEVMKTQLREGAMLDGFMNTSHVDKSELVQTLNNVKPTIIEEMDSTSPGAITMGFGGAPMNYYMHLPRYAITFARNVSFRLYADVLDLLTYSSKIHKIFHDLLIKDLIDARDRSFMRGVNEGCGTLDSSSGRRATLTGAKGYVSIGAVGRESMLNFRKALTETTGHLTPVRGLVNDNTIWDFAKGDRNEVGGDLAQKMWISGFTEEEAFGLKWRVTIKNNLVPNGRMYMFADKEFVGKFKILEDLTFVNKSEAWYLDTFCYDCTGGSLPNPGAFASAQASGSFSGWAADDSSS